MANLEKDYADYMEIPHKYILCDMVRLYDFERTVGTKCTGRGDRVVRENY